MIIWIIMFLKPSVGDGKQILYVRFSDVNNIPIGTRVIFAGKPVGEVVAIHTYSRSTRKALQRYFRASLLLSART